LEDLFSVREEEYCVNLGEERLSSSEVLWVVERTGEYWVSTGERLPSCGNSPDVGVCNCKIIFLVMGIESELIDTVSGESDDTAQEVLLREGVKLRNEFVLKFIRLSFS